MNDHMPSKSFMDIAIQEAIACRIFGEHPVGAIIVRNNEIISQAGNRTHRDNDPTHHAEIVAIGLAAKKVGRNLHGCILYTTHEPCPMCAAACVYARLSGIVIGTSILDVQDFIRSHPGIGWRSITIPTCDVIRQSDIEIPLIYGYMQKECSHLFTLLMDEGL